MINNINKKMKHYHNLENKKLMLKLEKPRLLHILSNNKTQFKNNPLNTKYKYSHNHNTSLSPLVIGNNTNNKTTNNNNKNNFIKSPKKTYNNIKDINNNNNIIRTTPLKYQYKKLPFEKVRGFKIKLPNPIKTKNNLNNLNLNNYKKNILNTQQNYYPIICDHNLSTIQSNVQPKVDKQNQRSFSYLNLNFNNLNKNNIINYNNMNQKIGPIKTEANDIIHHNNNNTNKKIIIFNDNKKPLHHLIETKSSSIGSKMETREESGHFKKSRSKSSFNSPQLFNNYNNINFENKNNNLIDKKFYFHKFDNINNKLKNSSKKKILKYLDKTIKQLTKIRTIILDEKDFDEYKEDIYNEEAEEDDKIQEGINNKFIKIIEKNLEKYKDNMDIDKNTINISVEGNNNETYAYNFNRHNNNKGVRQSLKKLNRTITYDDLKCNIREKQKLLNITQKSFKNFKKVNVNNKRNKSQIYRKYETINGYNNDYYINKNENNYKIKNYDTEINIPKLNINKKNINDNIELNKINEEENILNYNKKIERYNVDNEGDNNADIANFEFSD